MQTRYNDVKNMQINVTSPAATSHTKSCGDLCVCGCVCVCVYIYIYTFFKESDRLILARTHLHLSKVTVFISNKLYSFELSIHQIEDTSETNLAT